MSAPDEPRNPLYLVLLVIGLVFVLTVLAVAVVPILEQKAREAGEAPPPSPFRDALRNDGWKWLLYEVATLVVVGLASMALDRWRRYRTERHLAGELARRDSHAGNDASSGNAPSAPSKLGG